MENNILWIRKINVFSTVCFFHAFLSQKYINWKTYFIKVLKFMLHEFQKIIVQEFLKINVPRFFEIHGPWIFIGELYTLNKKNKCFFNSGGVSQIRKIKISHKIYYLKKKSKHNSLNFWKSCSMNFQKSWSKTFWK